MTCHSLAGKTRKSFPEVVTARLCIVKFFGFYFFIVVLGGDTIYHT
jgi:hypothetical protein